VKHTVWSQTRSTRYPKAHSRVADSTVWLAWVVGQAFSCAGTDDPILNVKVAKVRRGFEGEWG
jgi:hypothetical protein